MRTGRRWRRLLIALVLLLSGSVLFARLEFWRTRGELRLAQQEIARGRLNAARARLVALAARPSQFGGAANYWLGICESLGGRPDAALRAFARVPAGYAYDAVGAYHEAKANLTEGRLGAAERRLEETLAQGGPGLDRVLELLQHILEMEARFEDVKPLLWARLAAADDPIRDLKQLSNFDLDRLPYEGLRATLERAGELAPEDDRVWLGKARLAIESGRWDEAASWLARCRQVCADPPVWSASLEWARGAGRPGEVVEAARHLDRLGKLDAGERWALHAWLHEHRGDTRAETSALERWLQAEPAATQALERLAELAFRAGESKRVAEYRRHKAEVESARAGYRDRLWSDEPIRTAAERCALARLAEIGGRRHEARALFAWALKSDAALRSAREGLSRLDRSERERQRARTADDEPWPDPPAAGRADRAASDAGTLGNLAFTDDAAAVGLQFVYDNAETPFHYLPEPFGGGLALLDYDGDGWLDVYCLQGGPFAPSSDVAPSAASTGDRLFRNRRDGTFEDVTDASGIARFPRGHGHGVAVGDIDGDRRPDLFITRWRSYALYRNKGDGTFEDVTARAGLDGDRNWPTSAAFADLDGDGDLDLYVCHYAVWDMDHPRLCRDDAKKVYLNCSPLLFESLPDHLYRNDGGRFVDVTAEAGIVDRDGRGLGVVAADLDGDGRVDIFVANDSSANFLFRNSGGMRFEEIGHTAGVAGNASGGYQAGMGIAAGDLDGDGLIDLAVTNFYGESTTFYRNLGGDNFTDATAAAGLAVATRRLLGFGVAFFDANNDGRLDLASANGHVNDLPPNYPYRMPAQLLVGDAGGRLRDVSSQAGAPWSVPRMGRGLAVGDLDNDGRLDVLVLSHNQPLAYFHNRTKGGRFLSLRLEGRKSNRDAVGAKVALVAGGRRRAAQRVGGGSYQSASDSRIHFGLGPSDRIEEIEVTWPGGSVNRYRQLQADTGYLLREGEDKPMPLDGFPRKTPQS
jgi:hypothetical protein